MPMLTRVTMSVTPALVAAFAFLVIPAPAQAQGRRPVFIPGQYIVTFKDAVADPAQAAAQMARQHGLGIGHVYSDALKGFAATIPAGRLRALQNDPRVELIEQDQVVTASELPSGVDRIDADLSPTARIDGVDQRVNVDIAILDSGIQASHPNLNVVGGVNYTSEPSTDDGAGHGTHVAGTAAAIDNGAGVVGVAPGARLWAVKVLDSSGTGSLSAIVKGIDWVTAKSATIEVANMSLGFQGTSTTLDSAIQRAVAKGVVFTVSAGNSGIDAANYSPARHPDVLCVSAVVDTDGRGGRLGASSWAGLDDSWAYFSNFGQVVDIAAPGVDVLSTVPGGATPG